MSRSAWSPKARGRLAALGLDKVRAAPGVVAGAHAGHIPGRTMSRRPSATNRSLRPARSRFHGQALFAVVAESHEAARRAARLARIEIEAEHPSVTVEDALARGETVLPDYAFGRGDADAAIEGARTGSRARCGLAGRSISISRARLRSRSRARTAPCTSYSSTQHPTEVQHVVARVLGLPDAYVTCEVRRMGGGFGGKESQATQWAALAALAARITGRPCKIRLDRDDDFLLTGKRHDFRSDWRVGFDEEGRIHGYAVEHLARCGYSADLSQGVVDRTMLHSDNAYFLPAARIASKRLKTNTVSNTAFRGFGGPQGMLVIEQSIDRVAWALGRDPLDVRYANLYAPGRDLTPYGMTVEDTDTLHDIMRDARAQLRLPRASGRDRSLQRALAVSSSAASPSRP